MRLSKKQKAIVKTVLDQETLERRVLFEALEGVLAEYSLVKVERVVKSLQVISQKQAISGQLLNCIRPLTRPTFSIGGQA